MAQWWICQVSWYLQKWKTDVHRTEMASNSNFKFQIGSAFISGQKCHSYCSLILLINQWNRCYASGIFMRVLDTINKKNNEALRGSFFATGLRYNNTFIDMVYFYLCNYSSQWQTYQIAAVNFFVSPIFCQSVNLKVCRPSFFLRCGISPISHRGDRSNRYVLITTPLMAYGVKGNGGRSAASPLPHIK